MGKVNVKKWVDNFDNLTEESQFVVVKAIIKFLKENESIFTEEEYDRKLSSSFRSFLEVQLPILKSRAIYKKISDVLIRFNTLSDKNKKNVLLEVYDIINKYLAIQEQEDKKEECRKKGHDFKKWKHEKWTEYINTVIDHIPVEKYPVDYECWCRTCKRCGFEESMEEEPEEVRVAREEANKKRRIRRLENTLRMLKNN